MKIGWLLGWAVPEAWFNSLVKNILPNADHGIFPATRAGLTQLEKEPDCDWLVGYSLGALLLLDNKGHGLTNENYGVAPCKFALLAPIFGFCREDALGGKVARAQVRQLSRWLRRDPRAAIGDFYVRAGLDVPPGDLSVPGVEDLAWGLDRLEGDRVAPPAPAGWRAWCGAEDPFLDAQCLCSISPDVAIVPGAGHHPGPLVRAFAGRLEANR